MHHVLLFLPLLALGLFFILPWQAALPLYGLIRIVSLIGYWKALQAQRQPPVMGGSFTIESVVGKGPQFGYHGLSD